MRLPFEDVTILDLTWVLAGPHATRQFCELGATVIKVESTRSIDVVRTGGQRLYNDSPFKEGGWAFNDQNRGKLDIGLNLKSEKGRQVLEELVKKSDFVVANYGTGAFRKLKLTYDDLKQVKEDIIVLNASGLGDWGPYSSFVTFAPALMAMTGITGAVGYEGNSVPYDGFPPLADYLGAMAVCNHLAAALEYRRRTGKGQFIDLSQGEAAVSFFGTPILDWQVNGHCNDLIGNHHYAKSVCPHNAYKCKGNEFCWVTIAVRSEEDWKNFCEAVDPQKEWTDDAKFATLEARIANEKELDEKITEWTSKRNPRDAAVYLQRHGVSAGPLQTGQDFLYKDEHLQSRKYFQTIDYDPSDKYPETYIVTGPIMEIEGHETPKSTIPAPSLGRDTRMVLKEYLGKSDEWINAAYEEKAVE